MDRTLRKPEAFLCVFRLNLCHKCADVFFDGRIAVVARIFFHASADDLMLVTLALGCLYLAFILFCVVPRFLRCLFFVLFS